MCNYKSDAGLREKIIESPEKESLVLNKIASKFYHSGQIILWNHIL
jgi:hypothetical protein